MHGRTWRRIAGVGLLACAGFLTLGSPAYAQPQTEDSNSNYIDSAIVGNLFRFRYEAAYDDNRPERAEFFYAKGGYFHDVHQIPSPTLVDPRAPGPPKIETRVDYQDLTGYLELAAAPRLSFFVETPVRFLNPEQNRDAAGYGDMNAGFKVALVNDTDQVLTFQMRTWIPTGDPFLGLGTDHVSLEPALLVYERLSERLTFEGEFRDWIPIGGTDFAGNVIRYGAGLSYCAWRGDNLRVVPVAEVVGWTVLSGKEEVVASPALWTVQSARGDTIVNAKAGLRFKYRDHNDLAVSYGRALTGEVWYKDIVRVEYRLTW
jgi:hypothetical protein